MATKNNNTPTTNNALATVTLPVTSQQAHNQLLAAGFTPMQNGAYVNGAGVIVTPVYWGVGYNVTSPTAQKVGVRVPLQTAMALTGAFTPAPALVAAP